MATSSSLIECATVAEAIAREAEINVKNEPIQDFEMTNWHLKDRLNDKSQVANTWPKKPGGYRYAMGRNGKERENS